MNKLKEIFIELGYTKEEYQEIRNSYAIKNMKEETLINKVKENYEFLISLGYSKKEVIKMTKSLPNIYGYSIETMQQKIEDMEKLGYSKKEVIKMTKRLPNIYGYSIENMQQKIEDMEKLGYSKEEVIKMTKSLPTIYNYSIENMQQKIEDMEKLGYSKEEVIKMTKSLPAIYGYSIENMQQKIEFYDSIGMHFLAVTDSKQLMQSTKLSYARYMFFKEKGININEKNYKKLFVDQKRFERVYEITKEKILEMYPYKTEQGTGDKKEKSTQELGVESKKEQEDLDKKIEMANKLANRVVQINEKHFKGEEN